MIRGSCLCGSVRYEVRGRLGRISHCHCSMCRKAHGAAFGTYASVRREDFVWLSGADAVVAYRSSPAVTRTFCGRCGATLQFIDDTHPDALDFTLGTLDEDPGARPALHIFVASKAPWFEITDALPQHAASAR
ncbi:MAG: GFA family protein [Burkholderiales bacterium]|nr:GFA family protein [Burkholderiales bacterium]